VHVGFCRQNSDRPEVRISGHPNARFPLFSGVLSLTEILTKLLSAFLTVRFLASCAFVHAGFAGVFPDGFARETVWLARHVGVIPAAP